MMTSSKRVGWLASAAWAVGGLAALAAQTPACAQSAAHAKGAAKDDPTTVGEVIVTAQKRAQRIQDVPLSITAVGGDALKAIGHQDVTALVNLVPGFDVQQFSPTTVAFNIRGVGQNDFADSQEAPIAFYNDEVYVAAMSAISGQNYDLERIEVLKGPQGTLFGRNATGGLVQYITAKPTRTMQGYATATFGSYGEIGTEGAISGPLTDHVRGRLSFSSDDSDGYIKNSIGPDIGSRRFYAGRLQLESDVGDSGLLRLKVQYMRNDHETSAPYTWQSSTADAFGLGHPSSGPDFGGYQRFGNNPFSAAENNVPRFSRTYWSATARYEQKLGDNMQLTSITDYELLHKFYGEDSDVSPNNLFNYYQQQHFWQGSQEVRLSGKTDRLDWVGGVYGLVVVSDAHALIDAPPNAPFAPPYVIAGGPQRTNSYAAFGQGEYKVTDKLRFILGGRYSFDRKKDDYKHIVFNGLDPSNPQAILNPTTAGVVDGVFNPQTSSMAVQSYANWSGRIGLEYKPTSEKMLYLTINRGTKSGGFDIPNFPPLIADPKNPANSIVDVSTIPYKQEVLTDYEGGFKVSTFGRRLNVDGAVFHYDYQNYQAFVTEGPAYVIRNLPATITGGELSADARLADGLNAGLFATYLDTLVKGVTLPCGCVTTDRQMPQAPRWTVGWNGSYRRDLGPGALTLSTDWRFDGANYFTTFNAPIDREPGHVVGNVQLSYKVNMWTVSIVVNNVTNKYYRVYDLDNSLFTGSAQATYGRPRWIVGNITRKF